MFILVFLKVCITVDKVSAVVDLVVKNASNAYFFLHGLVPQYVAVPAVKVPAF